MSYEIKRSIIAICLCLQNMLSVFFQYHVKVEMSIYQHFRFNPFTQVFIFTLDIYWNFSHLINFSCRTSGALPFACIYIMLFLNNKRNEVLNEVVVNTKDKNNISFTFSYCNVTSKVNLVIISCYVFLEWKNLV